MSNAGERSLDCGSRVGSHIVNPDRASSGCVIKSCHGPGVVAAADELDVDPLKGSFGASCFGILLDCVLGPPAPAIGTSLPGFCAADPASASRDSSRSRSFCPAKHQYVCLYVSNPGSPLPALWHVGKRCTHGTSFVLPDSAAVASQGPDEWACASLLGHSRSEFLSRDCAAWWMTISWQRQRRHEVVVGINSGAKWLTSARFETSQIHSFRTGISTTKSQLCYYRLLLPLIPAKLKDIGHLYHPVFRWCFAFLGQASGCYGCSPDSSLILTYKFEVRMKSAEAARTDNPYLGSPECPVRSC